MVAAGENVRIILHTGGTCGKRLIQTEVDTFDGDSYTTLTYRIVQNFEESYRCQQNFDVEWDIPKSDFAKLRGERKFYILRYDDVLLHS